jgi:hypothetical protein
VIGKVFLQKILSPLISTGLIAMTQSRHVSRLQMRILPSTAEPMSILSMGSRLFICVKAIIIASVISTFSIDSHLVKCLAAVRTHHIILLKFVSVFINELSPLIHFLPSLFVELFLIAIISLFKLLAHLENSIVFLSAENSKSLIVLVEKLTFS